MSGLFHTIENAIAARRATFITETEEAVARKLGDDSTPQESEALLAFASRALRAVELGATDSECQLWQSAIANVATGNVPATWPDSLRLLETNAITPQHLVLLRAFADPAGVHQNFGIGVPANMGTTDILRRVFHALDIEATPAKLKVLWTDLISIGLACGHPADGRTVSQLPDAATEEGCELVALVVDPYAVLKPVEKPLDSYKPYPTLVPTPLRWLADSKPNKYVYSPQA